MSPISSALWGLKGLCVMKDIAKESSLQLYFVLSVLLHWHNCQCGSSAAVQTSGAMDVCASQLEQECTFQNLLSRMDALTSRTFASVGPPLHNSD